MAFRPTSFLRLVLLVALHAVASATTWYVNGVSGRNTNNCLSATAACKTIGHAISLSAPGDTIRVAAATYAGPLTLPFNLNLIGAGVPTTIVQGGDPVLDISAEPTSLFPICRSVKVRVLAFLVAPVGASRILGR